MSVNLNLICTLSFLGESVPPLIVWQCMKWYEMEGYGIAKVWSDSAYGHYLLGMSTGQSGCMVAAVLGRSFSFVDQ